MNSRLRVGLLLDSVLVPAWAFTAIERIVRSTYAELSLVVLNQSQQAGGAGKRVVRKDDASCLFRAYNTIDQRLFLRKSNALTEVDASEIFYCAPIIEVIPIDEEGKQYFSAKDLRDIRAYHLDILVKLGFGKLDGDILTAATYGVWSYRWGEPSKLEDGLTGFWEVVRGWPETGVALQQLRSGPEHNVILFASWFSTYPYSPARNRNCVLWAAASFLPRQVERLHRLGEGNFLRDLGNNLDESPDTLQSNKIPSNLRMLWIILILGCRNLLEIYRRVFYREHWNLLFNLDPGTETAIAAYRKMAPPKDCFWADPHVVYNEPNYYIFVEELSYKSKKGHISAIEMDQAGNYKKSIPVLEKDYHLSFPSVFAWMNHYFMVPESSENKTIDIYECVNFPGEWQFKMTLMENVTAVDTALLHFQGKWWLFTAIAEQDAAAPQFELFLFHSNELFTEHWQSHPMNPIISDVKKARAAGRIFVKDGKLYRPSQNCSKTYGNGFDINEIVALSETEYCERTVRSVRPGWGKGIIGTHTYAYQNNLTVIDILTRQFKLA